VYGAAGDVVRAGGTVHIIPIAAERRI